MKAGVVLHNLHVLILAASLVALGGCASVPMATHEQDAESKTFPVPPADKAGVYVYRNSFLGKSLKKTVSVDGISIGKLANETYFYKIIAPGKHTLSTESEFGDNSIVFQADSGKNYFARQYMKMGVLIGGSGIEMVSEDQGKKEVLDSNEAQ